MVFELPVRRRTRISALIASGAALLSTLGAPGVWASEESALQRLADAQKLFLSKQYFQAARYAFAAADESEARRADAHAWVAVALVEAGLEQSASYFYIRALESGDRSAIRRVLPLTERMFRAVGPDMLGSYLLRNTRMEDHDPRSRSAFQYLAAREALFSGDSKKALGFLAGIDGRTAPSAELHQLRAAAQAAAGNLAGALADFETCEKIASEQAAPLVDLSARCAAGRARLLYEKGSFEDAEQAFERVSRQSIVWTEILFEQGWNAFRRGEYNRTLGRLVSYKSPALAFVHNPEIDVLRAQSYLALCLYRDANEVVNDFNQKYGALGDEVKQLLSRHAGRLSGLYDAAKAVASQPLQSSKPMNRLMNRFVRSPSFQRWMKGERDLRVELQNIQAFTAKQPLGAAESGRGFGDFLKEVLDFRMKSIRALGGAFVKNSLIDYHSEMIANFEKMSFIKLEMLGRFKQQLMGRRTEEGERGRGNVTPVRRDNEYFWSFNGEFWNDELGDYVFALESECRG